VAGCRSDKIRTGSDSDQPITQLWIAYLLRIVHKLTLGWSLPPPHAGCPRGDPGSLPVLPLCRDARETTQHTFCETLADPVPRPSASSFILIVSFPTRWSSSYRWSRLPQSRAEVPLTTFPKAHKHRVHTSLAVQPISVPLLRRRANSCCSF
jgi:hypothetical protein